MFIKYGGIGYIAIVMFIALGPWLYQRLLNMLGGLLYDSKPIIFEINLLAMSEDYWKVVPNLSPSLWGQFTGPLHIVPYLFEGTWWSSHSVNNFLDPLVLRINCLVITELLNVLNTESAILKP